MSYGVCTSYRQRLYSGHTPKNSSTGSVALIARDFSYLLSLKSIQIGKGLPDRQSGDPRGGRSQCLGPLAREEEKQEKTQL